MGSDLAERSLKILNVLIMAAVGGSEGISVRPHVRFPQQVSLQVNIESLPV